MSVLPQHRIFWKSLCRWPKPWSSIKSGANAGCNVGYVLISGGGGPQKTHPLDKAQLPDRGRATTPCGPNLCATFSMYSRVSASRCVKASNSLPSVSFTPCSRILPVLQVRTCRSWNGRKGVYGLLPYFPIVSIDPPLIVDFPCIILIS